MNEAAKRQGSVGELDCEPVDVALAAVDACSIRRGLGQPFTDVGLAPESRSPNAFALGVCVLCVVPRADLREAGPTPRLKLRIAALSRRKFACRFELAAARATKSVGGTKTTRRARETRRPLPTQPLALVIAPTIPALRRRLARVGTEIKLRERLRRLAGPTSLLGLGGVFQIDSDS